VIRNPFSGLSCAPRVEPGVYESDPSNIPRINEVTPRDAASGKNAQLEMLYSRLRQVRIRFAIKVLLLLLKKPAPAPVQT
jgi:hypothetical protein